MKIAIMTWFQFYNYGTALQVTAMHHTLKKLGHDPYIINYETLGKPILIDRRNHIQYLYKEIELRYKEFNKYNPSERENKFKDFYNKHIQFTERCYTKSDLEKLNLDFDAFLCGSDQIWAPSAFNPRYYLDFVMDSEKILSYAPSVGLNKIEDKYVEKRIAELTSRFKYISTREKTGSQMIGDLIHRQVDTVLDPTFLLDKEEWLSFSQIIGKSEKPYILVYMLGKNGANWSQIRGIAEDEKLELKIIPVFKKDLKRKGCLRESVGPEEFISLVNRASVVCTDSFHGLVFSIIFNKPFYVFERFSANDSVNQNSRIYNVLNLFGLENRLVNRNVIHDDNEIDYEKINRILSKEREHSINYLITSLYSIYKYALHEVNKKNVLNSSSLCCGCGVCKTVCPTGAIDIVKSEHGFYVSNINEGKCISCGKCICVCPFIENKYDKPLKKASLFSYKDNDANVLLTSSSGGLGYRLAHDGLLNGKTVIGAYFDIEAHKARHILLSPNQVNEVHKIQGSKYLQSDFSSCVDDILNVHGGLMIFGTPCQIAGIKNLIGERDDVLLVDLICHGVPSYNLYKKYLTFLSQEKKMNIDGKFNTIFRYKPMGWRDIYIYNDDMIKSFYLNQHKDLYFLSFEHGHCYSECCYECRWRDSSCADIRLGDYWHRKYNKDKTGVSMGVALTSKGEQYMLNIQKEEKGSIAREDINDYFACQQTINLRKPVFWEELQDELCSDRNLKEIVKDYVLPFEKKRKLIKYMVNIRRVIKRYVK